jgi:hypothetical protein
MPGEAIGLKWGGRLTRPFDRPVILCCVVLFIGYGAIASTSGQPRPASPSSGFVIRSIRAMPYYPETGTIRRATDLFDPRLALRNIILGSTSEPDPHHRSKIEDWDILVFGKPRSKWLSASVGICGASRHARSRTRKTTRRPGAHCQRPAERVACSVSGVRNWL